MYENLTHAEFRKIALDHTIEPRVDQAMAFKWGQSDGPTRRKMSLWIFLPYVFGGVFIVLAIVYHAWVWLAIGIFITFFAIFTSTPSADLVWGNVPKYAGWLVLVIGFFVSGWLMLVAILYLLVRYAIRRAYTIATHEAILRVVYDKELFDEFWRRGFLCIVGDDEKMYWNPDRQSGSFDS